MYCEKCGAEVRGNGKFCRVCGNPLRKMAETQSQFPQYPDQETPDEQEPTIQQTSDSSEVPPAANALFGNFDMTAASHAASEKETKPSIKSGFQFKLTVNLLIAAGISLILLAGIFLPFMFLRYSYTYNVTSVNILTLSRYMDSLSALCIMFVYITILLTCALLILFHVFNKPLLSLVSLAPLLLYIAYTCIFSILWRQRNFYDSSTLAFGFYFPLLAFIGIIVDAVIPTYEIKIPEKK